MMTYIGCAILALAVICNVWWPSVTWHIAGAAGTVILVFGLFRAVRTDEPPRRGLGTYDGSGGAAHHYPPGLVKKKPPADIVTDEEKRIIRTAIEMSRSLANCGVVTFVNPDGTMISNYVPLRTHFRKHTWTEAHNEYALKAWHGQTE